MNYQFQPIDKWPREFTKFRKRATFRCNYDRALNSLRRELSHIGANQAVVMAAFREEDIRLDGLPRSSARAPVHPGIIIASVTKFGPMKWACDNFTDWQANIRAIGLTLERLRLADLYGVTKRGEQYTGWKELPGPIITPAKMTVADAMIVMTFHSGFTVEQIRSGKRDEAYRAAARKLHPDANGGQERQDWHALQEAKATLDQHLA